MLSRQGATDRTTGDAGHRHDAEPYKSAVNRISILSAAAANQIAAGEVVERPSSIVKELVENAIDAGATKIVVEVEGGGRARIRVIDDGDGMGHEDAQLAFERHATSKLENPDDLFSIRTLGFRGEALPSIASVARVRLETQLPGAETGTSVEIAGGEVTSISEGAFPPGTEVVVEDVFYNVPARRKFLKSESYELSQVTAHCTHYALAFPEIHFVLKSGAFELLSAPPAANLRERIFQVFGGDLLDEMVEYETEHRSTGLKLHVFTSRPQVQKYNRNSMYFFVNGRAVREKVLFHAYTEAYRNVLPSGTFPVTMLYIQVRPADIDVNVHPAKTEVRFRRSSVVHDAVRDAVVEALRSDKTVIPMTDGPQSSAYSAPRFRSRVPDSWGSEAIAREPVEGSRSPMTFAGNRVLDLTFGETQGVVGSGVERALSDGRRTPDFDLVRNQIHPLGQLRDSFIVAADESGLVVIDQHVAHERVLFEQYERQKMDGRIDVQKLLTPILLELSPKQEALFESLTPELARNGFEVSLFGPRTVAVETAPAILKAGQVEKLLREVIDGLEREDQDLNIDAFKKKIGATVSCHAAIKINNSLDSVKMRWLVTELMKTDCPTVCPHGRPIIVRYDLREIQKAFKRV
jgi:DNA mismatch repair protein MutL